MKMLLGIPIVLTVIAGGLLFSTAMILSSQQLLIVKVDAKKDLPVPIVFPIPMALVKDAAAFIPGDIHEADCSWDFDRSSIPIKDFKKLADGLAGCPDGVYVNVTTLSEKVRVEKKGRQFMLSVHTPHEQVECNVPIDLIRECAACIDKGHVDMRQMTTAFSAARFTRLVKVVSPEADVTIWSW